MQLVGQLLMQFNIERFKSIYGPKCPVYASSDKVAIGQKQKATNLHGINRLYRPGAGRKPATFS